MQSKVVIVDKPSWVSFDDIHDVLWKANELNRKNGFKLRTAELSGGELEERIGTNGKCFVALEGEKIVGTISIRMLRRNNWYAQGEVPDYMLAAVLPEYQGQHLNTRLSEKVFDYVKNAGYQLIELDTAEDNLHAIAVYEHLGFKKVNYVAIKDADHYSVVMAKWLENCPFSEHYCRLRYSIKRILVRIRYKVGKVKRFGI